jgi:hypothetical protein
MTNQLPDSYVVQQFRDFLDSMEAKLEQTLEQIETLKAEDPEYGHARAVGCARAHLMSMQISARATREVYLNA